MGKSGEKLDQVLTLYSIVQDIQKYEGEGIWSRFNIMVSVNTILMAAIGFLYSTRPDYWRHLVLAISLGGLIHSVWALHVLHKLWMWHAHWKNVLTEIEKGFPKYLVQPMIIRPSELTKKYDIRWSSWLSAYTQPFIIVTLGIWMVMLGIVIRGLVK